MIAPSKKLGRLGFFQEFLRARQTVGAICPSSRYLARLIVEKAEVTGARAIVELGPGNGVFTRQILSEKSPDARFIALEKNPSFAEALKTRFPQLPIIEGCATQLDQLTSLHLKGPAESIVSGLPWAAFPRDLQTTIIRQVHQSLSSAGVFTTFAYFGPHWTKPGRSFRQHLQDTFREVQTSRIELRNLPPAFVYIARK